MKSDVVAVILAAGIGKRFWPLSTYKYWVPFLGAPLLHHNLELLKRTGIKDVIVVTAEDNVANIQSLAVSGLRIRVVVQDKPSGMADALLSAKDLIMGKPIFVMNAADVVEQELYETVAKGLEEHQAFIVGKTVTQYLDVGYLDVKDGKLVRIFEKPGAGNEPSNIINLVFHYFPLADTFLKLLTTVKTENDDVYEVALQVYTDANDVHVYAYDGPWSPIKYPWHILSVMDQLFATITKPVMGKNVEIKSNVVLEGPVVIGDNVIINEFTKIVGPCFIGCGTIVGNNVMIRHAHIGQNSVVGFNSDITRSYIGDNCWFHSNYVGDSVLGDNVSMGAGTVTANVRLDEKHIKSAVKGSVISSGRSKLGSVIGNNVRIGSNTTLMPGVKIGAGSFVGAGVLLGKDLEDNSFCMASQVQQITKNTASVHANSRQEFRNKLK